MAGFWMYFDMLCEMCFTLSHSQNLWVICSSKIPPYTPEHTTPGFYHVLMAYSISLLSSRVKTFELSSLYTTLREAGFKNQQSEVRFSLIITVQCIAVYPNMPMVNSLWGSNCYSEQREPISEMAFCVMMQDIQTPCSVLLFKFRIHI